MYHNIENNNSEISIQDRPYVLREQQFEKQMNFLYNQGYRVISLTDFVNWHKNKLMPSNGKYIILSFDDGHISNYSKAFPILNKYGFKAIFFVIVGAINKPGMLSWKQIMEMADSGMEIGSHTLTHRPPSQLTKEELKFELSESKKILEYHLEREIKFISSPTGYHNKLIGKVAKEVGYEAVCIGKIGSNNINSDLFSLKRIAIKRNHSLSIFRSLVKLHPNIFLYYKMSEIFRDFMKRLLGFKIYETTRRHLLNFKKKM